MKMSEKLLIFITIFIIGSFGIPTPAPSPSTLVSLPTEQRDDTEHTAEDDTDMLMEPDEFREATATTLKDQQQQRSYFNEEIRSGRVEEFHPIIASKDGENEEFVTIQRSNEQIVEPVEPDSQTPAAQTFFPSFFRDSPPLGHSRPYYPQQHHEQRESGGRFSRGHGPFYDQALLGSGNFGVIRGGTFYQENDPAPRDTVDNNDYFGFFNNNNGHGRPHASPYTAKFTYPDDQFANFRDFADINTPTDPAYSHFVVVYANKNSTNSPHSNPKNIFEQLQLIDEEAAQRKDGSKAKANDKISKTKLKLVSTKLEKKYKKKLGPKDGDYEPLLALS